MEACARRVGHWCLTPQLAVTGSATTCGTALARLRAGTLAGSAGYAPPVGRAELTEPVQSTSRLAMAVCSQVSSAARASAPA
jgi:hypothetical protein